MADKDVFKTLVRDVYKLFAIWPKAPDEAIIQFAADEHEQTLLPADVDQFRQACGLTNSRFKKLGQTVVEWRIAMELSTFGYSGRTKEKLVLSALDSCEQIVKGKFSALLVSEWVEEVYEQLAPFAMQPMKIRVFATEKAAELRELLGCEQLPQMSLRA